MILPDLSVTMSATDSDDPTQPSPEEVAAMHRLAEVALGSSGQANRCANFLLAWSDADRFGAYDPTDIWACDPTVIADTVTVFGLIARVSEYPELLDPTIRDALAAIVTKWRR